MVSDVKVSPKEDDDVLNYSYGYKNMNKKNRRFYLFCGAEALREIAIKCDL